MRIQTEREHRVIDAGPYRMVRHPAYLGLTLWALGSPLLLASWTARVRCSAGPNALARVPGHEATAGHRTSEPACRRARISTSASDGGLDGWYDRQSDVAIFTGLGRAAADR